MDQVILLGHSAGGQFVSRYAALNTCHEDLQKRGASICYVAANPSSYLYLDATRYQLNPNGEILKRSREELTHCERYNDYKYGLENLYGYANSMSKQDIRARLTNRPVVFLLGQADTERTWSLDQSCEVEVQGQNRYERGLLYRHHLTLFTNAVQNPQHHWVIIPEVGHDADEMLTHRAFIQALKALPGPNNNFRANRP